MSNLIPVKKPDKNGKLVTRHMKPEQVSGAASKLQNLVPQVAPSERERMIQDCGNFVYDGDNKIALSSLTDDELSDLAVILSDCEKNADFQILRSLLNPEGGSTEGLGNELKLLARYNRLSEGGSLSISLSCTRGLWGYEFLKDEEVDRAEEIKHALMKTSMAAFDVLNTLPEAYLFPDSEPDHDISEELDNYYSFFGGEVDGVEGSQLWIRNSKFVDLIARRPEKVDDIVQIMHDRKTLQPDAIEAILDFDAHPSLMGGAL